VKIELLFLGRTRTPYLAAGISDYADRLSRFVRLEIKELKDLGQKNSRPADPIVSREGEQLLKAKTRSHILIALDRQGRSMSSEKLAQLFQKWEGQGIKGITFAIGGPMGLAPAVTQQADLVLSFSKMTFPHEMARLFLVEQIYRAYSIKAGTGYHK
jgi:23S rRNA (pseudouridine1915-N3)-methyltransferase